MPRNSLSPLEILLRQTKADAELDAHPEVRKCLVSRIRGLQRLGLDQDEQDIAVGQVLDRRFLLLSVPGGRLATPEQMGMVVRVQEQVHKANNSRRRRAREMPQAWRRPVPSSGALWNGPDSSGKGPGSDEDGETEVTDDDAAGAATEQR